MKNMLYILAAVLALQSVVVAADPPKIAPKQKCSTCENCKCPDGFCPGKCTLKAKGNADDAWAAVATGQTVVLCVGVDCVDGAYATGPKKGVAAGVYDCYKAADGTHLMQIRTAATTATYCVNGTCYKLQPASVYGLANPKSPFEAPLSNCPNGNCSAPTRRR